MKSPINLIADSFQEWASSLNEKHKESPEWESDWSQWDASYRVIEAYLESTSQQSLTESECTDLLFILARDSENQEIQINLSKHPNKIRQLTAATNKVNEPHASWQLADIISDTDLDIEIKIDLLEGFLKSDDEYVRRRALNSFAKISHCNFGDVELKKRTELHASNAWESGNEYQMISALWALHEIGSKKAEVYIESGLENPSKIIRDAAKEVKISRSFLLSIIEFIKSKIKKRNAAL